MDIRCCTSHHVIYSIDGPLEGDPVQGGDSVYIYIYIGTGQQ